MENLKLVFKIHENSGNDLFSIGHVDGNTGNFYGEVLCSILYSRRDKSHVTILSCGFSFGGKTIGILTHYSCNAEYFSLISPGKKLNNEFEYKKELYLIRAGLIEKPIAYDCLEIRIPDNWEEIFKDELNK